MAPYDCRTKYILWSKNKTLEKKLIHQVDKYLEMMHLKDFVRGILVNYQETATKSSSSKGYCHRTFSSTFR